VSRSEIPEKFDNVVLKDGDQLERKCIRNSVKPIYIYIYKLRLWLVEVNHVFQPYVAIIRLAHKKKISTQLCLALRS